MNRQTALMVMLVSIVFLASVAGVVAREDEVPCIPQPAQGLSLGAITQSISYIMAGGIGPILILAIAFIVGMLVSHIVWGGF
jgi:hypothetical protein